MTGGHGEWSDSELLAAQILTAGRRMVAAGVPLLFVGAVAQLITGGGP